MIKLEQQSPYFSLQKLENYELEDFTIITGLNGSGKTHLLKAINEGVIAAEGINQSGIIYYNYNDFNLFYGDITKNNDLQIKNDIYTNKSTSLLQSLAHQRALVLNGYKINQEISLPHLESILLHTPDIFNWSEKEIETFEKKQNEENFIYNSNSADLIAGFSDKQNTLLKHINQNIKTIDIRKLLSDAASFLLKTQVLNIIRNYNYGPEILDWDNSQIEKYNLAKMENSNFQLNPMFIMANTTEFTQNFASFVSNIQHFLPNLTSELIKIKNIFREIYDDIIIFFRKKAPKDYLQLSIQINGDENILKQINVNSGFLNLHEIANAEKNYQTAKEQNQYNQFQSERHNKNIHFYSDEEFLKIHGDSPVKLLNEVLDEYDCNGYEFKQSQVNFLVGTDISQQNITISLYNKKENYVTSLEALSSGEKTLIALSFYIYKLQKKNFITNLLLLDEIDSSLHPSMSKRLLDVLYNIFYKKLGIKIIVSTHSPSTVALAPDKSIFIMDKYSTPRVLQVSKDRALKELTIGVPSFSINHENRRQVFVESEYDVTFYEDLYNIYSSSLNSEISLNFISSGDSRTDKNGIPVSNCDQVIKITKGLREYGNKFVWGIIDWDLKDREPSEGYIKVLGFEKRYSIENFLLDPLLLSILLWRERILNSEKFAFDENKKYPEIINFDELQFQMMIDRIVTDINKYRKDQDNNELIEYNLLNEFVLKIPKWYCEIQGHNLEDLILKTYPQLQSIRKNEPDLKKAIINKVIQDFPHLAPIELLNILKSLQKD